MELSEILKLIAEQGGGSLIIYVLVGVWGLDRSGLFKYVWRRREARDGERIRDGNQVVANYNQLVENLQEEIEDLRERRLADQKACDDKLDAMELRISEIEEGAKAWRVDALRWRHLSGNFGMYIDRLRQVLEHHGIEAPRFEGYKQFIAEGGTMNELDPFNLGLRSKDGEVNG